MNKWRLINYTDVWGNKDDGWDVNNICVEFDDLYLDDSITDKEILSYLKQIRFLATDDMRSVRVVDWGDLIEIETVKGNYPLGRLERVFV